MERHHEMVEVEEQHHHHILEEERRMVEPYLFLVVMNLVVLPCSLLKVVAEVLQQKVLMQMKVVLVVVGKPVVPYEQVYLPGAVGRYVLGVR